MLASQQNIPIKRINLPDIGVATEVRYKLGYKILKV